MTEKQPINMSKVPAVTLGFWAIKIIATTLGEVGGNAVSLTMELGYLIGSIIFGIPLLIAVALQIRAKKFHPALYWLVITLTTLAGTTLADFFDRSMGIGYMGGSIALFSLVLITLFAWHKSMGSVDIETVVTPKAEIFYWTTIMFSQTLGTALGDWMADSSGLGYKGSAIVIGAILILLFGLYLKTKTNRTFLFWAAFVLTRPLGAVLANSFDKPIASGGMGISDITLTAVLAAMMVVGLMVIPQKSGHH